ncbi:MAG: glycosyltransferase family 2 protein [Acidimicrobiales bacterium]
MVAAPLVSVVVCTRDRPHMLAGALRAVRVALREGDEAVVVDSASRTDATIELARDAGFHAIRLDAPGLSRARNAGVAATTRELIAFTDDDCLPESAWLDALRCGFADSRVGIVTGRLRPEAKDAIAPADDPGETSFAFGPTAEVAALGAGANLAVRRVALDMVGGFDEALGAGTRLRSGEDHDLMWRVLRAGWNGAYRADAVVVHRAWRGPGAEVRMRYGYGLGAGAVAAKVAKVDPHTGRRMLLRRAWHDGIRQAAVDAGRRYERAAIGDVLFAAGVTLGAFTVWRRPLINGRLCTDQRERF